MKKILILTSLIAVFSISASAQTLIAAKDAGKHIGETVTIYDKIFGSELTSSNITYLYMGGHYPDQQLIVIIKAVNKSKFKGHPDVDYKGKDFCVTGKLISYHMKPALFVDEPGNLKVVLIDNPRPIQVKQNL